jgi:hypothetical protein
MLNSFWITGNRNKEKQYREEEQTNKLTPYLAACPKAWELDAEKLSLNEFYNLYLRTGKRSI